MTSSISIRGLLTYAAVLPLAILIGYLMATPTDYESFAVLSLILGVMALPLALRWHREAMVLTWNMTAVLFFLPGRPQFWVVAACLSFMVVVVQKTLGIHSRSLRVGSVTAPLIFLLVVIFVTAKATGGIGVRALGSNVVGGKAYYWILAAALGYFAMVAYPVASEKRHFFVGLFLLGALTNAIGSSLAFVTPSFYYIFLIFPVDALPSFSNAEAAGTITRYGGLGLAAMGLFYYILTKNKVEEIVTGRRFWALLLCGISTIIVLGSGYRSHFIMLALVFAAVAYLEGVLRTRYAVIIGALVVTGALLLIPLADRLPMSIQRALSVLPINVSEEARLDADQSTQWRVDMWRIVIPEIPRYFWLGKGVGINRGELEMAQETGGRGLWGRHEIALQTGAYHNGALTVLIPFGIWGLLGFVWFLIASIRALNRNYKYGDPALKLVNRFLLAYFCTRVLFYFAVFGEFRVDFPSLLGVIGLSLALNAGIRQEKDLEMEEKSERHSLTGDASYPR